MVDGCSHLLQQLQSRHHEFRFREAYTSDKHVTQKSVHRCAINATKKSRCRKRSVLDLHLISVPKKRWRENKRSAAKCFSKTADGTTWAISNVLLHSRCLRCIEHSSFAVRHSLRSCQTFLSKIHHSLRSFVF